MALSHHQWDPAQYLRYGNERLRPALDLLDHVAHQAPLRVVDLGCGTGQLCDLMKQRWPTAEVLGLDGSDTMLSTARDSYPGCRFELADIQHWQARAEFDVIFSNAAFQWLPDHQRLFPDLLKGLRAGGYLAVQMPAMHDEPLRALQLEIASQAPWLAHLAAVPRQPPILSMEAYYALLQPLCATLDIWQTTYLHALEGEDAVVQWACGTSLRPYLAALPESLRDAFKAAYARALAPHYLRQTDGRTLLPFKRTFIVAQAAAQPRTA